MAVASQMGVEPFVLPCCPAKFIGPQVRSLFANPAFNAGIRYSKKALTSGGILNQPAMLSEMIDVARAELRLVAQFNSQVREQRRKKS